MKNIEVGIISFGEATNLKEVSYEKRIKLLLEEIKYADKLGLDFFGIGEHHRSDYAVSSPITVLSAAATITNNIKLGSAVVVLSSEDPVRLLEQYNTLNIISNNRAELMVGRGSFIESFPLFGYNLNDYHILFEEKLELLYKLRNNENVNWQGETRAPLNNVTIYPKPSKKTPISIGVGGSRESIRRAAKYGAPLVIAIIGGNPLYFKSYVETYKTLYVEYGHDVRDMHITVAFHGFISEDKTDLNAFKEANIKQMNVIAKERGWGVYDERSYLRDIGFDGALMVGDSKYVTEKLKFYIEELSINRVLIQFTVGTKDHDLTLKTIEILANKIKPNLNK
jgi:probable LLM family oxidoreductase